MLLGRLRKNLTEINWFAVIVDVSIVIVGILLAFQIDRWADQKRNQYLELEYLVRLKHDLQMEMELMDSALEIADDRIRAVKLLEKLTETSAVEEIPTGSLPWAVETATWRSFPNITSFVYRELQNTGNLALIQAESLR